jgi:hypothetical protein
MLVTSTSKQGWDNGPFQLVQATPGKAGASKRAGIWRLAFPSGQMLFEGWSKAIDWLDDEVAKSRIKSDAILLAGPYSVPWLLDYYLIACEEAEADNREGVFDAYASSAKALLETDSAYHDQLMAPWVKERANRAT